MGRNKDVPAFPVDEQLAAVAVGQVEEPAADQEPSPAPTEFIAQGDTMTVYGATVDGIVEADRTDLQRIMGESAAKDTVIAAKNAKIEELVEYGKAKNGEITELKKDLGVARMLLKDGKVSAVSQGIERLPGGGIRLAVTLDCDDAAPLLSWAEGAGEDPETYIAKIIQDAVVSVVSS
jgi:myo-inositol-1-phosphate synthase